MSSLQTIGLLFYLKWVWKVDYLADPWRTLLLVLAAGFFGIAVGLFIGASNRWPLKAKVPLGISLMLLLSAASGMMGPPLRLFIEKNLPWLNRYNPVNMISRTIYRLNVLESTKEFSENVVIFFVAGVFLCIASLLFMRKRQFKSL
jgi:ABC-2 type transport system permease protein